MPEVFGFEVGSAGTGQGFFSRVRSKLFPGNQYRFRVSEAPGLKTAEDWGAPNKILIPNPTIEYLPFEFPPPARLKEIGKSIADAIFQGQVVRLFATSLTRVGYENRALRVMFSYHNDADSSARNFPWESIFYTLTQEHAEHFGLSTALSVARFFPPRLDDYNPLPVADKLRVLAVAANPKKCAIELGVTAELSVIEQLARNWEEEIAVHSLVDAQWKDFDPALVKAQPHVLFFTGHGGFLGDEPHLFFQKPNGDCEPVSIATLAAALKSMSSLKLVILSACQTATPRNPFVSGAEHLIQSGIPAVIAMQSKVDDFAAAEFGVRFFTYLFQQDFPIDKCVNAGRQAMQDARRDKTEWAIPVLFLATRNAIFDFRPSAKIKQEESKRRALMEEKFPLPVDPFIPRPTLTKQFDVDGSGPRLTVVSGPFGAGKTQITSKFCIEMIRTRKQRDEAGSGSPLFFYVLCKKEWNTFDEVLVELVLQTRQLGFEGFKTIINDTPRFGAANSIRMFSELLAQHDLVIVFDDYVWDGPQFWHDLFLQLANYLRRSKVFVITSSPQHAGIGQQSLIKVGGILPAEALEFLTESTTPGERTEENRRLQPDSAMIHEMMALGRESGYLPGQLKSIKDNFRKGPVSALPGAELAVTELETEVLRQLSVLRRPVTLEVLALMLAPDKPSRYLEAAQALQNKALLTFTRNLGVELPQEGQEFYQTEMNDRDRRRYHQQAAVFYERRANAIDREEQLFHEAESREN
jgi:hypothetical protein